MGLAVLPGIATAGLRPQPPPSLTNALEIAVSLEVDVVTSSVLCIVPTTIVSHRGFTGPQSFVISVTTDATIVALETIGLRDKKEESLRSERKENEATALVVEEKKKKKKKKNTKKLRTHGKKNKLTMTEMKRASVGLKSTASLYADL